MFWIFIFFKIMNLEKYKQLNDEIKPFNARLIAVSKTKPAEDILALYKQGQLIFF